MFEGVNSSLVLAPVQEISDAGHHLGDAPHDGALAEHAVVLGDVLCDFVDVDDAGELELAVGLLCLVGLLRVGLHGNGILNLLHSL